mmetsp:Transcript_36187/g.76056  ORF Transcript_36187/g.76056 Transcript_36187/m.76056 type:complete len:213 (+) Transcript_36187:682-1320(+)
MRKFLLRRVETGRALKAILSSSVDGGNGTRVIIVVRINRRNMAKIGFRKLHQCIMRDARPRNHDSLRFVEQMLFSESVDRIHRQICKSFRGAKMWPSKLLYLSIQRPVPRHLQPLPHRNLRHHVHHLKFNDLLHLFHFVGFNHGALDNVPQQIKCLFDIGAQDIDTIQHLLAAGRGEGRPSQVLHDVANLVPSVIFGGLECQQFHQMVHSRC